MPFLSNTLFLKEDFTTYYYDENLKIYEASKEIKEGKDSAKSVEVNINGEIKKIFIINNLFVIGPYHPMLYTHCLSCGDQLARGETKDEILWHHYYSVQHDGAISEHCYKCDKIWKEFSSNLDVLKVLQAKKRRTSLDLNPDPSQPDIQDLIKYKTCLGKSAYDSRYPYWEKEE